MLKNPDNKIAVIMQAKNVLIWAHAFLKVPASQDS